MKFLVFHVTDAALGKVDEARWPEEFVQVAEVVIANGSLDEVFRLTNTIEGPWWKNEGVKALKPPYRSTSVGDIIVDRGYLYLISSQGYKQLVGYTYIPSESGSGFWESS